MEWSKEFRTALFSLAGVGTATYRLVLNTLAKYETTEAEFWGNRGGVWSKIPINEKIVKSIQKFKKEHNQYSYFDTLQSQHIRVCCEEDSEYPFLLKHIELPPPVLFLKGAPLHTNRPLGVVGTRQITPYGKQVIRTFVPEWVKEGREIVSGFMYGVDICAQQTALEAGGYTIGVLGFGFDWMYPRTHARFMEEFLQQGATFLSLFAPHVQPRAGNFPARNTVIAGMCEATCVIEAAFPSGSLLTAQMAADFGRDVWAVPGSVFSRFSLGTQHLLQQGALCLSHPADVKKENSKNTSSSDLLPQLQSLSSLQKELLFFLQAHPVTIEDLVAEFSLSVTEITLVLSQLQTKRLVEEKGVWWHAAV